MSIITFIIGVFIGAVSMYYYFGRHLKIQKSKLEGSVEKPVRHPHDLRLMVFSSEIEYNDEERFFDGHLKEVLHQDLLKAVLDKNTIEYRVQQIDPNNFDERHLMKASAHIRVVLLPDNTNN